MLKDQLQHKQDQNTEPASFNIILICHSQKVERRVRGKHWPNKKLMNLISRNSRGRLLYNVVTARHKLLFFVLTLHSKRSTTIPQESSLTPNHHITSRQWHHRNAKIIRNATVASELYNKCPPRALLNTGCVLYAFTTPLAHDDREISQHVYKLYRYEIKHSEKTCTWYEF